MAGTGEIRVVHLEDDEDLLALTREYVERHNDSIAVEGFTEPAGALDRVRDGNVDCVVTDYKMTSMDGLAILERIREDSPDLPVIFFTGKGSEEIASEAISLGVTDYLQKGTGTEQFQLLGNRIESLVTRQRAEERAAEADQRIRQVYERITIAFVALDADFRFTYANATAEELFGATLADLEGRVLWESFTDVAGTEFEAQLRTAMSDQVDTHCEGDVEIAGDRRHLALHAYPSEDGVSVFVDDRTAEVQREAELETLREELEISEQQFRTLRQKLSRPTSPFR